MFRAKEECGQPNRYAGGHRSIKLVCVATARATVGDDAEAVGAGNDCDDFGGEATGVGDNAGGEIKTHEEPTKSATEVGRHTYHN